MASVLDPTLERHFQGHRGPVNCVDFSPNHQQLASASADRSLLIWRLAPKARALHFVGHQDALTGVQFSPAGNLVATSSKDRTVRLWTPHMTGKSTVMNAHLAAVRSVAFSYDGHKLVTASDDKSVKVWSVPRQCFDFSLSQHTNWVRCARFSPDGRLIASCGDDRSVRLWDTSTRRCINCFTDYGGSATFVGFNPSGTCIASAGEDSSLKIWDLRTNNLIQHYQVHSTGISSFSFHPSNNYLISSSTDGTVKILDLLEGRLIYTLHGHKGAVMTVSFSRNGEVFATGGTDRQVLLWRTNFDRRSYQDVVQRHSRISTPDPPPHISDFHPRGPYLHDPRHTSVQITPTVTDTQSAVPDIIELGHVVHSTTAFLPPTEVEVCSQHFSNGVVGQNVASARQEGWTGDESVNRPSSSSGKRTLTNRAEKQQEEQEESTETRPVELLSGQSSSLDSILQHIVQQLDVLTQTVSVLEKRLTMTEDKLKECLVHQTQIISDVQGSGAQRRTGSEGTDASS